MFEFIEFMGNGQEFTLPLASLDFDIQRQFLPAVRVVDGQQLVHFKVSDAAFRRIMSVTTDIVVSQYTLYIPAVVPETVVDKPALKFTNSMTEAFQLAFSRWLSYEAPGFLDIVPCKKFSHPADGFDIQAMVGAKEVTAHLSCVDTPRFFVLQFPFSPTSYLVTLDNHQMGRVLEGVAGEEIVHYDMYHIPGIDGTIKLFNSAEFKKFMVECIILHYWTLREHGSLDGDVFPGALFSLDPYVGNRAEDSVGVGGFCACL